MFKNNAFIFTFHLKQHTPIILFQIEQEGATLIATKLKPKLDRFIIAKFQSGTMQSQKRYHFVPDMFKFITQTYQILKSGTGKKGKDGIRQCERELKFSAKDTVFSPLLLLRLSGEEFTLSATQFLTKCTTVPLHSKPPTAYPYTLKLRQVI